MGRLTLNVLLSFAQFEREVTSERIRDKIAASKKKGLWMGGPVPLGYEVIDRKRLPVEEEAERVREIMRRYITSTSANELLVELEHNGIRTKLQRRSSGPHRGGIPFRRGSLFHLLQNPIYSGKIVHKGKVYEGEHDAIVNDELWNRVQARLQEKAPPRKRPKNEPQSAMLRGLITDLHGRPMVPTYATKGTRRYAYYETRKDLARPDDPCATRFPQATLERHLLEQMTALLDDEHALRRFSGIDEASQLSALFDAARTASERLGKPATCEITVRTLIKSMQMQADGIKLLINPEEFGINRSQPWNWCIALPIRKPFREAKIKIDGESGSGNYDQKLVKLLVEAMTVQRLVLASPQSSLNQLARQEGRCRTQLAKLLLLSWLSPSIVTDIFDGDQPKSLNRARLLSCDLPVDWSDQERILGLIN